MAFHKNSLGLHGSSITNSVDAPAKDGDMVYQVAGDSGVVRVHKVGDPGHLPLGTTSDALLDGIVSLAKAVMKYHPFDAVPQDERWEYISTEIAAHFDDLPLEVGAKYDAELINSGDVMAEFTLIEGRLVVLSNVNGDQRFKGEHAVVEQYFRPHGHLKQAGYLIADDMTFAEAVNWCMERIREIESKVGV